jgi:cysteine desulfurase
MSPSRQVYLDYAASTPVDPRVLEAMLPYFSEHYGNASSAHGFGRRAENVIEGARETVARVLNCQPKEIVFTSGGSESDNLAIRGAAWKARQATNRRQLVTTPVEHEAVGRTVWQLSEMMGFAAAIVPVDHCGQCRIQDFMDVCGPETALASIMYANNEVGTIQPIRALAEVARNQGVLFHTDAVQAAGQLSLDVNDLGVDLMSLSGHKFYGPKGIGALYIREGVELLPSQTGGSHENGRRAGTQNTPLIVGFARALEIAYDELETHNDHYRKLRDILIEGVLSTVPQAQLSGHPSERLPAHASFVIEGIDSAKLLMHLDINGVAASGGSACKTGNPEPSKVLMAMGYSRNEAVGGLRLTVGRQTQVEDVEYAVDVLAKAVQKLGRLRVYESF